MYIMTLLTCCSHYYIILTYVFLADTSRVHLSKVGDKSDYINACHIDVSSILAW